MMKKNRQKIIDLMGKHLVAWYQNATSTMKDHYLVTPENLADFIDAHFEQRKKPKPYKQVLEDSK